jgi:hypothetical protein
VTLWVYDPNKPDQNDVTLRFSTQTWAEAIQIAHNVDNQDETNTPRPIYCLFRTNYQFRNPTSP